MGLLRDLLDRGLLVIDKIPSEESKANIFTKKLEKFKLQAERKMFGVVYIDPTGMVSEDPVQKTQGYVTKDSQKNSLRADICSSETIFEFSDTSRQGFKKLSQENCQPSLEVTLGTSKKSKLSELFPEDVNSSGQNFVEFPEELLANPTKMPSIPTKKPHFHKSSPETLSTNKY